MVKPLNIGVVGAGFAGLASACLLARAGHRVTVLERFAKPQSLGAGVLMQPTGLAVLRQMGLLPAVLARGAKVHRLLGVNPQGRTVLDIAYARYRPGSFGLGLHRGVLFDALWNRAQAGGVEFELGQPVESLAQMHSRFDLTVIADGANSALRAQTGIGTYTGLYPWGALWTILDVPAQAQSVFHGPVLLQWYRLAHQMLGIMPTGCAPNADRQVLSMFWSLHAGALAHWRVAGLAAFKSQIRALSGQRVFEPLLEQIQDIEQLTWARYWHVRMRQFHSDKCVVIGDAAHATSPQLGQGTNLALMDAWALAQALSTHASLDAALPAYTQMRRTHNRFYGQASAFLTPLFQSHAHPAAWLRDRMLARSQTWPFFANLNLQTLVGVRTGWLYGRLRDEFAELGE